MVKKLLPVTLFAAALLAYMADGSDIVEVADPHAPQKSKGAKKTVKNVGNVDNRAVPAAAPAPTTETMSMAHKPYDTSKDPQKEQPKDFKPIDHAELTRQDIDNYVNAFAPIAVAEYQRKGILPSITLAQGIVESRAGTSKLARNNNNHFGQKCFSKTCPKGHCSNHFDDHHKDFFVIFRSAEESCKAHSEFLHQDRYKNLFLCGKDYKAWARALQAYGYATDPQYANKLIRVIEAYNLQRFDN